MDLKHEIITTIVKALTGFATYLLITVLSVLGMLGNNMYIGKKLTWWQSIGLVCLALSFTLVTAIICYKSNLGLSGYIITGIVPYTCDKIVMALMAVDWNKSVKGLLRDWFKRMSEKMK